MPEIEPRVDEEKLRLLLAEGHESAQLDYKVGCNLRERRELVATTGGSAEADPRLLQLAAGFSRS